MGMLVGASIVQRGLNREEGVKTTPASIIVRAVNKQLQGKERYGERAKHSGSSATAERFTAGTVKI